MSHSFCLGHLKVVELLAFYGASVTQKTRLNILPKDLAAEGRNIYN